MPNTNAVGDGKWTDFRLSVDQIEQRTGYDLLSNLPSDVQRALEAETDQVVVQSAYLEDQRQL
jgi:endonuclease G